MNTSDHNRALDDIDVREEETEAGIVPGGRIEFATFTEAEYVESILVDRIRATVIYRDLGRILGVPSRVCEAPCTDAPAENSLIDRLSSSVVEGRSSGGEGEAILTGSRHYDRTNAEIHSLLVASTSHVTAEEAQALTGHGYSRGESGFFFYVGQREDSALAEIEPLSDGLAGVVRYARELRCLYVLLDRDAEAITQVTTYEW